MADFLSCIKITAHGGLCVVSNLNLVQSGGADGAFASMPYVGTAPIVESGSNANGYWIKFADGTIKMSLWGYIQGLAHVFIAKDILFPVELVGLPKSVVCSLLGAKVSTAPTSIDQLTSQYGEHHTTFASHITNTGCKINDYQSANHATGIYYGFSIEVTGRWKA